MNDATQNRADKLAEKRRYRAPVVYRETEVSLDDFDDDDIRKYLEHRGKLGPGEIDDSEDGLHISEAVLGRIFTLSLCGQHEQARREVLDMVSEHLGRQI